MITPSRKESKDSGIRLNARIKRGNTSARSHLIGEKQKKQLIKFTFENLKTELIFLLLLCSNTMFSFTRNRGFFTHGVSYEILKKLYHHKLDKIHLQSDIQQKFEQKTAEQRKEIVFEISRLPRLSCVASSFFLSNLRIVHYSLPRYFHL